MLVLAINGSPKADGNTHRLLRTVLDELAQAGIKGEELHIGATAIRGCTACGGCARNRNRRCVIESDPVNDWIKRMAEADGLLFGTPVYFAGLNGTLKCFLDRAFYVSSANGNLFRHKVGASVAAVRRTGGMPALEAMNHYLMFAEMFIPTSNYWNVTHGRLPGEAEQDIEGQQTLRVLGKNMAWLMHAVAKAKTETPPPDAEPKTAMHFIR